MSERLVSAFLLVAAVYSGVWAALNEPGLVWVFAFLVVVSFATVVSIWSEPIYEGDE